MTSDRLYQPSLALTLHIVMAGLVPAIHAFDLFTFPRRAPGLFDPGAWMPGKAGHDA
jgi:hypothetical protein